MDPQAVLSDLIGLNLLGLDSDLSLYALLVLCVISMIATRGLPLSWSWRVFVKAASLVMIAILGLTIGPNGYFACAWLAVICHSLCTAAAFV